MLMDDDDDDGDDDDDDKIETCPSQGRTRVLSHLIPHSSGTRCPQLVTLYDMQENAAGINSSPEPAGVQMRRNDCIGGSVGSNGGHVGNTLDILTNKSRLLYMH